MAARPTARSASAVRCGAVGQPRQRVVHRVVAQPADQRLVVQRDRGVVGDRLQQCHVAALEAADLAQPVIDGERRRWSRPRRRSGARTASRAPRARRKAAWRRDVGREQERRAGRRSERLDQVRASASLAGVAGRPASRRSATGSVPPPRRSPSRSTSATSARNSCAGLARARPAARRRRGRAVELPAEAEQPLQAGVPVGQGGVRAVGDHQDDARREQRQRRRGPEPQGEHGDDARWAPRPPCRRRQRAAQRLVVAGAPSTSGGSAEDDQVDDDRDGRRQRRRRPTRAARRPAAAGEDAEERERRRPPFAIEQRRCSGPPSAAVCRR